MGSSNVRRWDIVDLTCSGRPRTATTECNELMRSSQKTERVTVRGITAGDAEEDKDVEIQESLLSFGSPTADGQTQNGMHGCAFASTTHRRRR
jgi:hypothetical protein